MNVMASQITGVSIVYSTVCLGSDKKKTSKLRVTGLCEGNSLVTSEFPAQRASNAENVSIWWRFHVAQNILHNIKDKFVYTNPTPMIGWNTSANRFQLTFVLAHQSSLGHGGTKSDWTAGQLSRLITV